MNSTQILRNCNRLLVISSQRLCTQKLTLNVAPVVYLQQTRNANWFTRKYNEYMARASHQEMVAAGTLLFGSCSHVNFSDFRDYFDMPDTFNSWFLVTELHVFMVSNRLMHNQDPDAKIVMQNVQKVLWKDCNQRISNVAAMGGGKKSKMMNKYGQEFLATMIFYDRGLLNSDMDLATSLWRRFFHASETINGPQLELLVKYVRQSMQMLDHIPTSDLMKGRQIKWLRLEDVNKDLQ